MCITRNVDGLPLKKESEHLKVLIFYVIFYLYNCSTNVKSTILVVFSCIYYTHQIGHKTLPNVKLLRFHG